MIFRSFQIFDNRVTYFTLREFKNHNSICYRRQVEGCTLCRYDFVKRVLGRFWLWFGWALAD